MRIGDECACVPREGMFSLVLQEQENGQQREMEREGRWVKASRERREMVVSAAPSLFEPVLRGRPFRSWLLLLLPSPFA